MRNGIYILTLTVLFNINLIAQSSFGFRYELYNLNYHISSNSVNNESSDYNEVFPFSFYLSLSHQFDNKFTITVRPGILLAWGLSQYNGLELSLCAKYNISDNFYALVGLNLHDNWYKIAHSNTKYPEEGLFQLFLVGGGFKLLNVASVELQFLYPFKKHFGNYFNNYFNPIDMNYIIKLGVGLEWEL